MKKWLKILLCTLVTGLLAGGCAGKPSVEPEAAVDMFLKVALKGETEEYAKLVGEDPVELKSIYQNNIKTVENNLQGIRLIGVNPIENHEEEIKKILLLGKYNIEGSQEDEEHNYTVKLDIYPSNVKEVFYNKVYSDILNGDSRSVDEIVAQAMKEAADEAVYGEKISKQVHIILGENKIYEPDPSDLKEVLDSFFPAPEFVFYPSEYDYDNAFYNMGLAQWPEMTEEEKTNCARMIIQKTNEFTDEQMKYLNMDDPSVQGAVQQIIDGISTCYDAGLNIKIGDYVSLMFRLLE